MASTVGEQLQEARLARGQTLEQAAQTTRIRRHFLEALERNDPASLPSPVQARGFLRLYAGFLGLNAEKLVAQWEGRPLPEEPVANAAPASRQKPTPVVQESAAPPPAAPPIPIEPADTAEQAPITIHVESEEEQPEPVGKTPAGGSQAIFNAVGQELRRQREKLSLSMPDVERYTRLRQHYLKAMEAGRFEDLPSMVQTRGMLSNYATFLNLDSETILLRYAEGLQQRRLERIPTPEARLLPGQKTSRGARQAGPLRRLLTPDLLIGGGLILALFVFIIWTAARISASREDQAQATLPSVGDVILTTPSATIDPAAANLETTPQTTEGSPGSPVTSGSGEIAATPTLAALNDDPLQIYLISKQRAFLRVIIDGELKFNGRSMPGNAYPFSGKNSIEVIVGNGAAFQLFYNQNDLGLMGRSGQAVAMTFTQNGITTPTPLPTPTLAPTTAITATPGPSPTAPTPTITPLVP